jgi:hypothetical protein
MAGQMEEIDARLKRIDKHLDAFAFTLNPKNAPSIAGLVFGISQQLGQIEKRLQKIEEKLGISN